MYNFDIALVYRIWDVILIEEPKYLYKLALAFIDLLQGSLACASLACASLACASLACALLPLSRAAEIVDMFVFEECLAYLKSVGTRVNAEQLIASADKLKIDAELSQLDADFNDPNTNLMDL